MSYIRDQLQADSRFRMSMAEFEQLLAANEVSLEGMQRIALVVSRETRVCESLCTDTHTQMGVRS